MAESDQLKIDKCDYTCRDCHRSFHTETGIQRHRERSHDE